MEALVMFFLSSFLKHFFSIFVLIKISFTHLPTSKNGIGRGGRNTGGALFYTVYHWYLGSVRK